MILWPSLRIMPCSVINRDEDKDKILATWSLARRNRARYWDQYGCKCDQHSVAFVTKTCVAVKNCNQPVRWCINMHFLRILSLENAFSCDMCCIPLHNFPAIKVLKFPRMNWDALVLLANKIVTEAKSMRRVAETRQNCVMEIGFIGFHVLAHLIHDVVKQGQPILAVFSVLGVIPTFQSKYTFLQQGVRLRTHF